MDSLYVRRLPEPPDIEKGHSGYFTLPAPLLDPRLFSGTHIRPAVRQGLLSLLEGFWRSRGYRHPHNWSKVWLAGSAVSYQWHGDRGGIGDLDVLVGVDMARFVQYNPDFGGIPEDLIAKRFNNEFNRLLQPGTKNWHGFEVTFYVNPGAADIEDISPYAAYNLSNDTWTVEPERDPEKLGRALRFPQSQWQSIYDEVGTARRLVGRYQDAYRALQDTPVGSPQGRNAEVALEAAAQAAGALYEDIHSGRKIAFGAGGGGYGDFYNARWQWHKKMGTEQALRAIHDGRSAAEQATNAEKYGIEDLSANRAVLSASLAAHHRHGLL